MWRASVLTIFPEMFPGPLGVSLAGKALAAGIWSLETLDIRAAATDRHRTVDDTPAGGGPGMVMKADVLAKSLDAVPHDTRPRLLMSPRGRPLTQRRVSELAHGNGYSTRYAHNQKVLVNVGQRVKKGDKISLMGSTGHSTGPHVHFEVLKDGKQINPDKFIKTASN